MKVKTRHINGVSMSEVQTDIGSVNISNSQSNSVVDRVTPGLAIKYVAYGKESYQLKNKDVSISTGQFFLLRNDTYFKAANTNKNKTTKGCCVNLNLEHILLPDTILNNDLLFETPLSAVHTSTIGQNLHNFTSKECFSPEDIVPIIPELSMFVKSFSNDIYQIEGILSSIYKKKKTMKSIVSSLFQTREYMYENYKRKITLDTLVKVSGLSKYHLLRLFSRCFGISPLQLQQNLRMEDAVKIISLQSSSLTDIAIYLGYTDLATFSNHFKTKFGVSPSRYMGNL